MISISGFPAYPLLFAYIYLIASSTNLESNFPLGFDYYNNIKAAIFTKSLDPYPSSPPFPLGVTTKLDFCKVSWYFSKYF